MADQRSVLVPFDLDSGGGTEHVLGVNLRLTSSGGSVEVSASYTGTMPYNSASQLHPAVFIQDDTTKEILGGLGEFYDLTGVGSRWWLYE